MDGIIDDFTRVQRSRKKDLINIDEVESDAIILSVATGSPLEVKHALEKKSLTFIDYYSLYKYSDLELIAPDFMEDFQKDYAHNKERYKEVYHALADTKSQAIFEKVINFKISFDLNFMEGFTNNHDGQYFDREILPPIKNISFVDGGAYVGDTVENIIKNYPDFKKIYCIEPVKQHLDIAKRELVHVENIEFINVGLSSKKERLDFSDEKSFSSMNSKGNISIEVDAIDNIIAQKVDYIKLDIEGAEQEAIIGAQNTIKKYHPVLAICIYHKAEDWYKIPEIVLRIEPNYTIYLRHYMEGIFESVMYFIPKEK